MTFYVCAHLTNHICSGNLLDVHSYHVVDHLYMQGYDITSSEYTRLQ